MKVFPSNLRVQRISRFSKSFRWKSSSVWRHFVEVKNCELHRVWWSILSFPGSWRFHRSKTWRSFKRVQYTRSVSHPILLNASLNLTPRPQFGWAPQAFWCSKDSSSCHELSEFDASEDWRSWHDRNFLLVTHKLSSGNIIDSESFANATTRKNSPSSIFSFWIHFWGSWRCWSDFPIAFGILLKRFWKSKVESHRVMVRSSCRLIKEFNWKSKNFHNWKDFPPFEGIKRRRELGTIRNHESDNRYDEALTKIVDELSRAKNKQKKSSAEGKNFHFKMSH